MGAITYNNALTAVVEVSDLERSIGWYRDCLGFDLKYKIDEIGWAEVQSPIGGVSVGLSQVEEAGGKGGATLTWGVNDIAAARVSLEGQGVRFDGENQTIEGMVILCTFFDPDGNTLMLSQNLEGA